VDPRFRAAIAEYLQHEGEDRDSYARFIAAHVPYRDERRKARSE
jgi:predicted N-acyltransferase